MKLYIIEKPTKILTPYVRRFGQWLMNISGHNDDVKHAKEEQ